MRFGYKVLMARRAKGISLDKCKELMNIGVSSSYLSRVEANGEIPSPEVVKRICKAFDLDEREMMALAYKEKLELHSKVLRNKYEQSEE